MATVDSIIKRLNPKQMAIAKRLRTITKKALPEAEETVKWNAPMYLINGKVSVCFMIYDDHINLGFFKGAFMKSKLLEGTGKGLRHIKVYKPSDIKEKEFSKIIKQAARLN